MKKINMQERQKMLEQDICYSRVKGSRFMFYLKVFGILTFLLVGCYQLYLHKYPGKPTHTVQSSTKYLPEYK